MFDIEKLVGIVCEVLEAETEARKYNLEIRKEKGCAPDATLWVPSLGGSEAYRLGELSERCSRGWGMLADICEMLDIDQSLLIAAVKSMQRKERHNGRWDNPNYTCWMGWKDKEKLGKFLQNGDEWKCHYKSTGRRMAWCD